MKVGQENQSPPDDEWSYLSLAIEPRGLVLRKWQDDVVVVVEEYPVTSTRDTWYDVQIDFSGTGNEHVTVKHGLHGGTMATAIDASTGLASDHVNVGFAVGKLAKDGYLFDNLRIRGNSISAESMEQEFIYDVFGRRVAKTTYDNYIAKTTYYAYDGDRVVEELDGDGKVIASYVYGNYIDEVLEMWRDADGDEIVDPEERFYYLQDDMYNVLALTDHTGTIVERYEYGDYGMPTVFDANNIETGNESAYGNPYLFNGRPWDADTGLYWYRTRYMDPELGRFISRDSIGLWGDENNVGNPYTYAGNNPWTNLDPFGEEAVGEDNYFVNKFGGDRGGENRYDTATGNPYFQGAVAAGQVSVTDIHTAIDGMGMLPVAGGFIDLTHGVWYVLEGDYANGGFSIVAAIPLAGDAIAAIRSTTGVAKGTFRSTEIAFIPAGAEPSVLTKSWNWVKRTSGFAGSGTNGTKVPWKAINEVADPSVVRQLTPNGCGPACAKMLLADEGVEVFQSNIAAAQKSVLSSTNDNALAQAINSVSGTDRWFGGMVNVADDPMGTFNALGGRGSFATTLFVEGIQDSHFVVVDGLDALGRVLIRDPAQGTRYLMEWNEFVRVWEGSSLWR